VRTLRPFPLRLVHASQNSIHWLDAKDAHTFNHRNVCDTWRAICELVVFGLNNVVCWLRRTDDEHRTGGWPDVDRMECSPEAIIIDETWRNGRVISFHFVFLHVTEEAAVHGAYIIGAVMRSSGGWLVGWMSVLAVRCGCLSLPTAALIDNWVITHIYGTVMRSINSSMTWEAPTIVVHV